MDGDLTNKGISTGTVVNSGATVNGNGKFGKCYSFNGSSSQIDSGYGNGLTTNEKTIAVWVYPNGANDSKMALRTTGTSPGILYLGIKNSSWNLAYGSTTWGYTTTGTVIQNAWQHLCITIKDGVASLYYNGTLVKTISSAAFTMPSNIILSPPSYRFNGMMCDLRIYDHCLSAKEVSDIANGLVLHYPLNGSFLSGNVNLVSNGWGGTENWENTAGYSTTEIPSSPAGITHSYFNNTTKEYIPIYGSHSYTMSSYVKKKSSSASYYYLSLIPYDVDKKQIKYYNIADGFRTSSLTTLSQDLVAGDTVIHLTNASGWANPTTYQVSVAIFGYKDSTGYVYPDLVYTRRCYTFGTTTDKSNLDIENNTVTLLSAYSGETIPAGTSICLTGYGATYYYPKTSAINTTDWTLLSETFTPKNIKYLKPARYVRVHGGLNGYSYEAGITLKDNTADSVVYDSSGYCNNGTITGTIGSVIDSPRYDRSTTFNGTSYIQLTSPSAKVRTVSFWAKWNSIPSGQSVVFVDYKSKIGFGLMSTGILCSTNGVTTHTFPKTSIVANQWYHFAIVNTSSTPTATTRDLYINGVKQTPTSSTSDWICALDYLQLGKRSTTSDGFSGKISDFRMYVTALSAEDIMDLYNAPAYIDNSGTMGAVEFVENISNGESIGKTGVVGVKNFIEYSDNLKLMPDGSVFLKILRHNNPTSKLFTSANCWLNTTDPDLYSSLVALKCVNWMRNLNQYEFLACEKLTSADTENQYRWKQTNNPATTNSATGYQSISGSASHMASGLATDGTHGCFDINGNNWWCCCGCYTPYTVDSQTGIPGFNGLVTTGYLELYIRIPDEMIKGYVDGDAKFFKQSINARQFKEI